MRIGIDFGTTRTIVAAVDRGNYPLVTFETPDGSCKEWYPAVFAFRGQEVLTGFRAQAVMDDPEWTIQRSIKRNLAKAGPADSFHGIPVKKLITKFLCDLKSALLNDSNLDIDENEPLEAAVAVPAHATANQRRITTDAFREAGFKVIRMLDEPSAAGLEYAWRRPADAKVKKRLLAVYDLGGGTFDASFIELNEDVHEVITTEGIHNFGGDDFDQTLLDLTGANPSEKDHHQYLEICRMAKESFNPSTKRLTPEFSGGEEPRSVPIQDYEDALRPLIQKSLDALDAALNRANALFDHDMQKHTVVYQVGGASALPTVGRMLREIYGRRVWRSPYPHGSIAIGLAIVAEDSDTPRIKARFTRDFGLWREGDHGNATTFDSIFKKDTPLPSPGEPPLEVIRRYRAAHNIGHYRFVECTGLNSDWLPKGEITPWREVRFPTVAALNGQDLTSVTVDRLQYEGDEIEEIYQCDSNGVVTVRIANISANYSHDFTLHGKV